MGQALYRQYRPKRLDEVVGQEHVTKALSTALKKDQLSHAYLFTGPRGVGKTSIARILAHEINKLPYTDDTTHLDIIEIDAASNRRIDEIRDLRERVNVAPTSAKYKVYIIDEVHMLTREAFNALLKTLEEPPAHVVFILATTEVHKLPETIISRTQRFSFKPADKKVAAAYLGDVAKKEDITITDDALNLLAEHGQGSFRDSMSLLDQVRNSSDQVSLGDVQAVLGLAPDELINALIEQTEAGNTTELVTSLQSMHEQGLEPAMIARQLGQAWRDRLLSGQTRLSYAPVLQVLEALLRVSSSSAPYTLLEIILLQTAGTPGISASPVPLKTEATSVATASFTHEKVKSAITKTELAPQPAPKKSASKATVAASVEAWQHVLDTIKKDHNTLYGIARMAAPRFENNQLVLGFKFAFHQKRLNEPRNKKILAEVLEDLTGQPIEITCELITTPHAPTNEEPVASTAKPTADSGHLETISNIFGGGELLESNN